MNKPVLEFIVTHHDEPWDVGRKFFLMMSMQRNVDLKSIRVTLVQDGEEGALDWDDIFATCPFEVNVITIEHAGIAAARNAGLRSAIGEWVMFCDFDDVFSDLYSLHSITDVLPTDKADIIWMPAYREQTLRNNHNFIGNVNENFANTYAKMFLRSFLKEKDITFPDMPFEFEYVFCTLALSEVWGSRALKLTSQFTPYIKTLRKNSYTMNAASVGQQNEAIFYSDVYLVNEFERRKNYPAMRTYIARTFYDAYVLLNSTPRMPHHNEINNLFTEFYDRYRDEFENVKPTEIEVIEQECNARMINHVVNLYDRFRIETITPDFGFDNVRKWLSSLKVIRMPQKQEDTPVPAKAPAPGLRKAPIRMPNAQPARHDMNERIIVYTGTRNTYENILASMKSVLANSRVDHIYLMIEDDTFPYEIPDCVSVMNVSGQTFFPENGPNFNNAWSYMCLIRAAFTKLLPQHGKVLSLDIDTVITGNIDGLWDTDISGYYLAGVHEKDRHGSDYINFGVVMMNLDLMRKDCIDDRVIDKLNTSKQQCPEQDAFCDVCAGRILLLDACYNYTPFTHLIEEPEHEIIIHYAGIAYWKNFSAVRKYSDMPWDQVLSLAQDAQDAQQLTTAPSRPAQHAQKKHRAAVYCGTRNQYTYMLGAAKSLLCNSSVDTIYFLIEDDTFPEPLPDCFKCINVSGQSFFPHDGPNYDNNWAYIILMRSVLTRLLPDESVVLSLDNDTIVTDNIDAIWDTDLSDAYFAAVPEIQESPLPTDPYYNFGIVLFNLDKLRTSRMDGKIIKSLNKTRYAYPEQECMNKLCSGKIVTLPSDYNTSIITAKPQHERIHHYCGDPVTKLSFRREIRLYTEMSWEDVEQIRKGMNNHE